MSVRNWSPLLRNATLTRFLARSRPADAQAAVTLAISIAVPLAAYLFVLARSWFASVPVFQQDWQWPLIASQGAAMARDAVHIWRPYGLGFPTSSPNALFAAIAVGWLVQVLGPLAALHLFYAVIFSALGAGTYFLAREFGADALGGALAAAIAMLSPFLYNETFAGHLWVELAFAALPWSVFLFMRALASTARLALAYCFGSALFLAIAASQLQFIAIGTGVLFVVLLAMGRNLAAAGKFVAVTALAITVHAPDYWLAHFAQSQLRYGPQIATTPWEVSQSQPLTAAFGQFTYIGQYAQNALGAAAPVLSAIVAAVVLLALACAIFVRQDARKRIALAATLLIAAALVAGLYGPLGGLLYEFYAHVWFATAFRELYNFSSVVALFAAVMVGVLGARLRPVQVCAFLALAVAFALPYAWRAPGALLGNSTSGDIASLASLNVPGAQPRVLLMPGSPALGQSGFPGHGVDSFGQMWGRAAAVTYAADPTRLAYFLNGNVTRLDPAFARRLGISAQFYRSQVQDEYYNLLDPYSTHLAAKIAPPSMSSYSGPQMRLFAAADIGRLEIGGRVASGIPTWENVRRLPANAHLVSAVLNLQIKRKSLGINPLTDYVHSYTWSRILPELSCLPLNSVFKISSLADAKHAVAPCGWKYVRDGGNLCLRTRGDGLAASAGCAPERIAATRLARVNAAAADVNAGRAVLAYIRQGFDSRWRLQCGANRFQASVIVDGYAAGWIVPRSAMQDCSTPRVEFSGEKSFQALIALSAAECLILLAAIVAFGRRKSERVSE